MKVLHFTHSFSPLSETFIYDYVTELERIESENYVVTKKRVNEESRPFPKVIVERPPRLWSPRRLWNRVLETVGRRRRHTSGWPQLRDRWKALVRRLEPDVIHAHFGMIGALAGPVARSCSVPLVTSFHGFDAFKRSREVPWKQEYERLFEQAAGLTAVSGLMADHLVTLGAPSEKVRVVHVGKKMEEYPYRAPTSPPGDWLSVGRFVEKKGHEDSIRAFSRFLDERPGSTLRIIGDGRRRRRLENLIEELRLGEHVQLLGRRPHSEVKRRMEEADAFLLCSKAASDGNREGIPTVLMEAQAIGLPVVATRHSGIPEVIPESHHDFLAPEGDVEVIAERLHRLAGQSVEALRTMSEQGRRKVEREFNLRDEVVKLRNLYRSVC